MKQVYQLEFPDDSPIFLPSPSNLSILLAKKLQICWEKNYWRQYLNGLKFRDEFLSIFLFTKGIESWFIYIPYQMTWNGSESLRGHDSCMYFKEH